MLVDHTLCAWWKKGTILHNSVKTFHRITSQSKPEEIATSMATNKFATMLHKNTHRITVILVYAVLEWILIISLLLNSFFTYLIARFANYFGLKQPCLWCSRVDHILEKTGKNTNSYKDLVCDTHATEISALSYCSSHGKLAETRNMCMECLVSRPNHEDECTGMEQRIAFISWVSTHKIESGDQVFNCSCCNESLRSKYPPYLLFKSSWGAFDENDNETERNNVEGCHDDKDTLNEFRVISDVNSFGLTEVAERNCSRSLSNLQYEEKEAYEGVEAVHRSCDDTIVQCYSGENDLIEGINLASERNVDSGFNRAIPVELIDSSTIIANQESCKLEEDVLIIQDHECVTFESAIESETRTSVLEAEKTALEELENLEADITEIEDSSVLNDEQVITNQANQTLSIEGNKVEEVTIDKQDNHTEETNGSNLLADQTKPKSLESAEAANDHTANQPQGQEPIPSLPCLQEDKLFISAHGAEIINTSKAYMSENDLDQKHSETDTIQKTMDLVDKNQEGVNYHNLSIRSEPNEAEEEKFPETPTSVDSFHYLHKKLLLLEKRESGMEESLDGSVVSEMEGSDPVLTIERLKSTVKAERKAMSALYAELEEERSASAIAANQTMAMITRLQEEKAAMQMEALQYQRMMDEQSEYDQEALQLLNELMVKREKEKQELEKELEIYRKKVLDYEAKEKMRTMRRSIDGSVRSRISSASCSNSEDNYELSIDLNREVRDGGSSHSGHQESSSDNTPVDTVPNLEELALDCVKHMTSLDESLTEFEDERLSILDQLKVLEEKLLTLGDEEFNEDLKSIELSSKYNVNELGESYGFSSQKENGVSNGFSMASMAKSLLPLLDAAENETEEGLVYEEQAEHESIEMQNSSVSTADLDSKRLAIEDEVDHVYERLQALEADREFLKHCMSSVKKGDKGMDLLQEILQHLRDLRSVELRVRNMSEDTLTQSCNEQS